MKKLKDYSDEEWSYVSTAIMSDILYNRIRLNGKLVKQIFNGDDTVDAEDLLTVLVEPIGNWEGYIEQVIKEAQTWPKIKVKSLKKKETVLFCRACDFEAASSDFEHDIELDMPVCPECKALTVGTRKNIEEE